MQVNRALAWISGFLQAKGGEQLPYDVPPLIQPSLSIDFDWPLELVQDTYTGTLALGASTFNFFPGPGVIDTAAPGPVRSYPGHMRHHSILRFMRVQPGASLAMTLRILDGGGGVVDEIFAGAAATAHMPLAGISIDRRFLAFPYFAEVQITGAAGTEEYTLQCVRWDRPENCPLG